MTRVRFSDLAQADLRLILALSAERWGDDGRRRYQALIGAAIRKIASNPRGPTTHDRSELALTLRSFSLKLARLPKDASVKKPVHVLYYREVQPVLVEIVRVLHERMEPRRHFPQKPGGSWSR